MERYQIIKQVGHGAYGVVWKALNKQNGEVVAIKKLRRRYYSREECLNLREVKSLCKMNHPNIVKLKDIIKENDVLYLVFEYMECSLFRCLMDRMNPFLETEIRNLCFQVFQGLAYMHRNGYFHRDLKPENLLVSKDVIKIADLGQARETNSQPPFTEYVTTRWYRAPEVLLHSRAYGSAVDMWAMGAIMAELFTLQPLFPGSSEADQLYKICSVIGSPTERTWPMGLVLASAINNRFPELPSVHLSTLIPSASPEALDLIASLLSWHPYLRPTAMEALEHPFFRSCYQVPRPLCLEPAVTRTPASVDLSGRKTMEQKDATRDSRCLPDLNLPASASSWTKVQTSLSTFEDLPMAFKIALQDEFENLAFGSGRVAPREQQRHMLPPLVKALPNLGLKNPYEFLSLKK